MKNRDRQRSNRARKQELLEKRDICGVKDLTPYYAVKRIINKEKMPQRTNKSHLSVLGA